jgi:hypothetical protein
MSLLLYFYFIRRRFDKHYYRAWLVLTQAFHALLDVQVVKFFQLTPGLTDAAVVIALAIACSAASAAEKVIIVVVLSGCRGCWSISLDALSALLLAVAITVIIVHRAIITCTMLTFAVVNDL